MRARPRRARPSASPALRVLVAGTLVLGAVGSCELPQPKIPSIGAAPAAPALAAVSHRPAGRVP